MQEYVKSTAYSDDNWFCAYLRTNLDVDIRQNGELVCTRFNKFGMYTVITDDNAIASTTQFHVRISASYLSENTAAAYRALLTQWYQEGNPLTVYYQLANPTTTEITDTTLINQLNQLLEAKTYKNTTNIEGTGEDLLPIVKVIYKKDLETLFNNIGG